MGSLTKLEIRSETTANSIILNKSTMLNQQYLNEYWAIEQEKTMLAEQAGLTVMRYIAHLRYGGLKDTEHFKKLLKRQLTLIRLMKIKDIIENVVFVDFRKVL